MCTRTAPYTVFHPFFILKAEQRPRSLAAIVCAIRYYPIRRECEPAAFAGKKDDFKTKSLYFLSSFARYEVFSFVSLAHIMILTPREGTLLSSCASARIAFALDS